MEFFFILYVWSIIHVAELGTSKRHSFTVKPKQPDLDTLTILNISTSLLHHDLDGTGKATLRLILKACADIFVSLCESRDMSSRTDYEIAFGTNDKTIVRLSRQDQQGSNKSMPGVLSCKDYKAFWIRWSNGSCTAGKGLEITKNASLVNLTEINPSPVNKIRIMTGGLKDDWIIFNGDEDSNGKYNNSEKVTNGKLPTTIEQIQNDLKVDKKKLSSHKRQKTCANDTRLSSACIGFVGGFVIILVISFVIFLDCVPLYTACTHHMKKKKK